MRQQNCVIMVMVYTTRLPTAAEISSALPKHTHIHPNVMGNRGPPLVILYYVLILITCYSANQVQLEILSKTDEITVN